MSAAGPYRLSLKQSRDAAPIEFRFDGCRLKGIQGDTVASALLANNVRVVSRSFKFHRPRGIFSAGFEEPNAIVQLHSGAHRIPGVRATLAPLTANLEVSSGIGWPSVSTDALRAIDFVHPIFAAGFYNKTFIWPNWRFYEPLIRNMAGLGHAPTGPDPDRYDTQHAHCNVLVVGGSAAGIEAARSAAASEERVLLVELSKTFDGDVSALKARANVTVLPRTAAVAYYDHNLVALLETVEGGGGSKVPRERLWLVRTTKVVLATGAIEQPLIFSNNDRPGIMLAGAALKYLKRHAIAPGRTVVVATNNDSAYTVARELKLASVNVVAISDSRESTPQWLRNEMVAHGVRLYPRSMPINTAGFGALERVTLGSLDSGHGVNAQEHVGCDALLVSGGWSPTLHLFAQAGGKLMFSETARRFEPVAPLPNIEIVGSAAEAAEGAAGIRVSRVGKSSRQWVDLRHDVTVSDVELAVRENFSAVEHIKRHTTLGMSMDQGKVGQAPAVEVIARVRGVRPADLAHTTFRPPFIPVTLGAMVGRNVGEFYAPSKRTPLHALQECAGAMFDDFGEWQRAAAFPRNGESREEAMHREIKHVRNSVGLYDGSPLGKIEICGPDALEFANRFYISNLMTLKPDRARYGIMLRETGVIFDDGTAVVLDKDRVLLTTTSSGASRVFAWLEEWRQCEWIGVRAVVVHLTDQWSTVALTGQQARTILRRIQPECDVSNEAFPHLGVRVTRLFGSEARIYRVSFSGELTYEINVPADKGPQLWGALMEEGREFGIEPYGVDALLHLRMEKGFIHVGADTDGTTVPDDVGFGKPAANKQSHYIGKRSLALPENVRADRLQLVGLTGEGGATLPVGSHLRLPHSDQPTDGWITSAGPLSTDGSPVAMAVLRAGRKQLDHVVAVYNDGRVTGSARVVAPSFYDPAGHRMNA